MRRKDRLPTIVAGIVFIFLLICGLLGQVWGASEWPLRLPFNGQTADTCFVKMFVDSGLGTGYDSLSIDSFFAVTEVDTSFTVSSSYSYMRVISFNFFSTGDLDGYTEYLPALVIDSNRTEQGGAGSGPFTLKYYLFDTTGGGSVPIEKITVTLKNWALSSRLRQASTDVNGLAIFQLDADSVAALATNPLYLFPPAWDSTVNAGTLTDTLLGYLNVPAAAPGAHYVTIYLDVATGMVDSTTGDVIPRDRLVFYLSLVGESGLNNDDWVIAPKTERKRPNSSGRVSFTVMANTPLTPAGSYYSLFYRALDSRSLFRGHTRAFIVDTLTDPINILDCTETD